jgi:oxygen-independent coproporphyrinogen III oxidase
VAGLYIHIPFCRQKCHYCNFYSLASVKYIDAFCDTLLEEIYIQRNYLAGKSLKSIYFGGGTPSHVKPEIIRQALQSISKYYSIQQDPEITLEANPDDINVAALKEYKSIGINRISIGVQSFFEDDLKYLNRMHSAEQAFKAVWDAKSAGFENLSLDLIYGIPTLTDEKWEQNLEKAFSLEIPHISAYSLTVEEKTALHRLILKKELPAPVEEEVIGHFRILQKKMKEHGFLHYEISNFCKPGWYSKHNSMYWSGEHYLGIGPSAHSFNGVSRQWNVSNILQYVDLIAKNERFWQSEDLTDIQRINERIMVSLRTMWGLDLNKLSEDFGDEIATGFRLQASGYIRSGAMMENKGIYTLTDEGKLFADGIGSDLFLEP